MKLGQIKGLLPEKKKQPLKYKNGEYVGSTNGFNACLDLLAEREIEVSVCPQCDGRVFTRATLVPLTLHKEPVKCDRCTNGVIIKVKESK